MPKPDLAVLLLSALLPLTSCGDGGGASFDTPEATVRTFIGAVQAKDLERLSQCFSKSRDEFKSFWNKTASDEELEQGKAMFANASVDRVEDGEEGKKIVHVTLPEFTRNESLTMVEEGGRWLILDF